jgi:Fungal protein kinase
MITRQRIQGHTCYDITVDAFEGKGTVPIVFRTELILSDFATDALRGRGTRIFKARKLNPATGQVGRGPVATKDVWVDDDCDREEWIRAKIEEGANEEDALLIQQYFMTVLHHGDVLIFGQTDHTRNLVMHQADFPSEVRFPLSPVSIKKEARQWQTRTSSEQRLFTFQPYSRFYACASRRVLSVSR